MKVLEAGCECPRCRNGIMEQTAGAIACDHCQYTVYDQVMILFKNLKIGDEFIEADRLGTLMHMEDLLEVLVKISPRMAEWPDGHTARYPANGKCVLYDDCRVKLATGEQIAKLRTVGYNGSPALNYTAAETLLREMEEYQRSRSLHAN